MLSIIIPVYNSGKTITKIIKSLEKELSGKIEYEIILVDDGSTDGSSINYLDIVKDSSNLKLVILSRNFGQHNAILAGLRFAKGDFISFMDDDMQTPPEELWKLINKIEEGFDVVYANYTDKKHSLLKNIGSWLNNSMATFLLKKPKNLKTTSYFIIRKYVAKEILKYKGPYPYLTGLVLRITGNIGTVNTRHEARQYGKSNYGFIKLLRLWFNGFTSFSVKPLRISFFTGLVLAMAGFVSAIVILIKKFIDTDIIIGWTSIIVVILIFAGIQLISLGIIGEYIGRIFMSQNSQPQYIIKDKFNIK